MITPGFSPIISFCFTVMFLSNVDILFNRSKAKIESNMHSFALKQNSRNVGNYEKKQAEIQRDFPELNFRSPLSPVTWPWESQRAWSRWSCWWPSPDTCPHRRLWRSVMAVLSAAVHPLLVPLSLHVPWDKQPQCVSSVQASGLWMMF